MRTARWILRCALLGSATAAQAQVSSPPPAETQASAPAEAGLQDIIVTAQRRSENLQRAAVAISAVSGDTLASAGITRPTELTSVVPSLQVAPAAGPYALFYLRGVGNFNGNALSDSAVAFNFNGVYVGRPSSTTGFFYDLERVEVVKGPQGTLYGRNATGGAINVIPKRPDFDKASAEGNVEYGNYNALRLDAAVNVPLGENVALRAAGIYVRHDAYMNDGTDNQKDAGGRVSLRLRPTNTLSINLTADYFRQRGRGTGATPLGLNPDNRDGFFSPAGQAFVNGQVDQVLGRTMVAQTTPQFLNNSYWGVSSTIELNTPAGTITVIPAYREGKLDYLSYSPGFYIRQVEKDKQTSLEARIASDETHPLRYIAGLFYYDESNHVPGSYINQQASVNSNVADQRTKSMAVFGRLTYAIAPTFRVTAGARYTTEDKSLDGFTTAALRLCTRPSSFFPTYVAGCPTAQPIAVSTAIPSVVPTPNFNPFIDGTITTLATGTYQGLKAKRASFDRITYRAAADWDITPRNLVYASYETGFKSGGFFQTVDRGVFRPERIGAWTLGSKNRFFDNRLQLNLEAFYWRYHDQQISHVVADSSGSQILATENVGQATFKGVEVEGRLLVTRSTQLTADAQYLDARYDSFVYSAPNNNGGRDNGTACATRGTPGATYVIDCSGRRPPNAPEWTINLGAEQTVRLANDGKIVGNVRAHYQSRTLTGLEFTQVEYQSAYWTADAQVTYTAPGSRYSIGLFVNNAFDKTVLALATPVPFTSYYAGALRPPRTFGARAGVKF